MLTLRESTAKVTIVFGIKVLSTSSVSSLSTSVPSPPKGKQYLPAPLRDQTAAGLVPPEVPGGLVPLFYQRMFIAQPSPLTGNPTM